jgi:hypothetical protein
MVPPQPSQIGGRPVSTCFRLSGSCPRQSGQTVVYCILSAIIRPKSLRRIHWLKGIARHRRLKLRGWMAAGDAPFLFLNLVGGQEMALRGLPFLAWPCVDPRTMKVSP